MKKIILFLISCAMLFSLSACGGTGNTANDPAKISVNFDLSQYDAYGEVSCGLIWVEKTESSYDTSPETKFAYADVDGNIKSPWFNSGEFNKADFVNGVVVLKESPYTYTGASRDYARCLVYDTNFNTLVDGYFQTIDGEKANTRDIAIIDANTRGEVFGIANLEKYGYGLFGISKEGIVKFSVGDDAFIYKTISNLKRIKFENGYYIVDFRGVLGTLGNLPCYMGVFDKNGSCVFEPSEQVDYEVYSVKIISGNEFEIVFKGNDGKNYTVRTNSAGEFLSEPK